MLYSLSQQLRDRINQLLAQPSYADCPDDLRDAFLKLSQLAKYLLIDDKSILAATTRTNTKESLLDILFKRLKISRRAVSQLEDQFHAVVSDYGPDPFLKVRGDIFDVFLQDTIGIAAATTIRIQKVADAAIRRCEQLSNEGVDLNRQLDRTLGDANVKHQHICRDLQLILQHSTLSDSGCQKISQIASDALADMGVKVMWQVPADDADRHFVTQPQSGVTVPTVLRPCLCEVSDSAVMYMGILLVPQQEESNHE